MLPTEAVENRYLGALDRTLARFQGVGCPPELRKPCSRGLVPPPRAFGELRPLRAKTSAPKASVPHNTTPTTNHSSESAANARAARPAASNVNAVAWMMRGAERINRVSAYGARQTGLGHFSDPSSSRSLRTSSATSGVITYPTGLTGTPPTLSPLPRSTPARRIDQPLDRVDVVDVDGALRRLACRGPERLPRAPGRLRLRVELDRDGLGPIGVDPRADLLELAVQVGLDLARAVKLAAGAVHPADLAGEQPELAADQQPARPRCPDARRRA